MLPPGISCCTSFIVVLALWNHAVTATEEYFSSVAGLEKLLETEAYLLSHLRAYVESMTSQLDMLKSELHEIEQEHAAAANGLEEYLTSPVNAYLLIKRLDKDWVFYGETINNDEAQTSFTEGLAYSRENMSYPSTDDADGSAVALVRLQETYKLEVPQVAAGIINGVKYGSSMKWQDCFQLGQQLFTLRDFNHTIPWFKESFERLRVEDFYSTSESLNFLETMAYYHQQMGDFETALNLTETVLYYDEEREDTQAMKTYLQDMVSRGYRGFAQQPPPEDAVLPYSATNEFKIYEKVCRGELRPNPSDETHLRCRYIHRGEPYRLLMPFKMEEISVDPLVLVFHDIMTDREIEPIKDMAKPLMERSQVRSFDGQTTIKSLYRTSQNTWLNYDDLPEMRKLRERLGDITGLDMWSNEELQVANYGIGGHYEPHFDFFESDLSYLPEDGNRISTAIFYLSDVEQGGATAFPFLQKAIYPRKGSMVFWYNLHRSGEKDYRTKHAACPVLKGSKWIANVWTRSRGQEFQRPCTLYPDHDISREYMYVR